MTVNSSPLGLRQNYEFWTKIEIGLPLRQKWDWDWDRRRTAEKNETSTETEMTLVQKDETSAESDRNETITYIEMWLALRQNKNRDRNKTGIEIEWDSHRKKANQKWFQHCLEKETQWEKNWLLYNCLHTFSASAYTHLKRKTNSYFANTFAIRLYFWIYHIVIQNLKLFFHELLCTFLYKIMK